MARMILKVNDNIPTGLRKAKYTPKSVIYKRLFIATLFVAILEAILICIQFNN